MLFMNRPPELKGDDVKKSIRQLQSWLYQLNEQLRYAFTHLDEENLSPSVTEPLGEVAKLKRRLDEQEQELKRLTAVAHWSELELVSCAPYTQADTPRIANINGIVSICGGVRLDTALAGHTYRQIARLGAQNAPGHTSQLITISDEGPVRLRAHSDGTLSAYSQAALSTGIFISLACAYAI